MNSKVIVLSLALALPFSAVAGTSIYKDGWTDFNKNGVKDVYEDPSAPIDERVEDLLRQMTLEEKTCQLVTLYGYRRVLKDQLPTPEWKNKLWKDGLGALDEHLNSFVGWTAPLTTESPWIWPASKHAEAMNIIQKWFIEETRLGIPVDFTDEGIRGVEAYKATNFPTQLGLGSTWDRDLINKVGYITGREARLLGFTNVYAPILDVGRDQRWGRYEEIYGEDPYLVAQLGIQMVRGMQTDFQVASTAKHFAIYSVGKGAREGQARCDPQATPHEVEQIHMYPWKMVIRHSGLLGCMSSYNDYDGEPIQGSHYWLYDRLRKDFGFKGYVVSDSDAVEFLYSKHHTAATMDEAVRQSVEAGLNVRCTFRSPDSYVLPMRRLLKNGALSEEVINERVRDVLRVKFTIGLFDHPYVSDKEKKEADKEVNGKANNEVALRASRESLVLLKNNGLLPLDPSKIRRIAVVGPNANDDHYAHVHYGPQATESVTVFDGFRNALKGKAEVVYAKGCPTVDSRWPESELFGYEPVQSELDSIAKAVALVKESDAAVVVLGGNIRTCGENRTRSSLDLPGCQDLLLKEVYKTGKPVVLVLVTGRPLSINWADRYIPAIIQAFYPGAHGGTAVAEAILGKYNPGGKLSVTFPKTVGQIPFNFPYKPNSQIDGYSGLGPKGKQTRAAGALYNFGHGLSYTKFEFSELKLSSKYIFPGDSVKVSFKLKNTGKMAGDEVAQLYLHDVASSITVYDKMLRGFERVHLGPGEEKTVTIELTPESFTMLDKDMKEVIEPGPFEIFIGSSSVELALGETLTIMDPKDPNKVYSNGTESSMANLPCTLKEGEECTFALNPEVPVTSFSIQWRLDTNCEFEIQMNQGGGQFNTVASGRSTGGLVKVKVPGSKASDARILIRKGHGTISNIDFKGKNSTAAVKKQKRVYKYVSSTNEAEVPAYTLPDPLVLNNGTPVNSVKCWESQRRPELLKFFTEEMYGSAPEKPKNIRFKTLSVDKNAFDGLATRKSVQIVINDSIKFTILVHIPNKAGRPAPVFIGLNFKGNDGTLDGPTSYRWQYQTILRAGYGVATAWRDEIEPDKWDSTTHGIRDKFSKEYTWGAIAGWSWALRRILDYVETEPGLDGHRAIAIGHSRLGKAALWAAAQDTRFAMAISNNSGCCGAALSKRVFGENIDAIQEKFPHWFCKNLLKYSRNEQALPFDQHELLALIAPRPLYVASATEDKWADPKGEMLSAVNASPVYELYGKPGLLPKGLKELPAPEQPFQNGTIAYHLREGKHAITPYDWEQYIRFADKNFGK